MAPLAFKGIRGFLVRGLRPFDARNSDIWDFPARANYSQFDTETLNKMSAAYDAIVRLLDIKSDDPRTSELASIIARLADLGVRDVPHLIDQASEQLRIAQTSKKK